MLNFHRCIKEVAADSTMVELLLINYVFHYFCFGLQIGVAFYFMRKQGTFGENFLEKGY